MSHIEYLEYNLGGELYHHGVKGMKWGVRRARNKHYRSSNKSKQLSESVKNGTFGKPNPLKARAVAKTLLKVAPIAIGAATFAAGAGTGTILARLTAGIASANAASVFANNADSAIDRVSEVISANRNEENEEEHDERRRSR